MKDECDVGLDIMPPRYYNKADACKFLVVWYRLMHCMNIRLTDVLALKVASVHATHPVMQIMTMVSIICVMKRAA